MRASDYVQWSDVTKKPQRQHIYWPFDNDNKVK